MPASLGRGVGGAWERRGRGGRGVGEEGRDKGRGRGVREVNSTQQPLVSGELFMRISQ